MVRLSNILRLILHLALILVYGKYLENIISLPFLFFAFVLMKLLVFLGYKIHLRSIIAVPALLLFPWLVRLFIVALNKFHPTFLQIAFDMNFYLILFPLYISSIFSWYSLSNLRFRKYEVLLNGFLLFLLFWNQGNYKITLVPNPAYLALFTVTFVLIELLVLYLSISMERNISKRVIDKIKEFSLFFLLLIPLIIYLLLPLWKIYEEGSVAGGGGLLKSSMFRFDFSEYIKLETEISMSDDLVLMFRKEGPAERLLLRRYVLSGYEKGQGFYRDDLDKTHPPDKLLPRYTEFDDPQYESREQVKQELFLVNIDPTAFLSLNHPVNSQPIYNWDNSSFVRIYESDAMVSNFGIKEIDPLISMDESEFTHYTDTGGDDNIKRTAEEIVSGIPGSILKVIKIEEYFHNNYFYSLKPGVSPDGDQLSYFINDSKKGYCSYFAFSMALMCRSLGIPARVAVGFWVDPDVSVLNFYPVRADQAHAWVEVFFNDYGWIEFDPTSGTMYPGEQYPFASFSIDEFSPLIEEILENELVPENLIDSQNQIDNRDDSKYSLRILYGYIRRWWYLVLITGYILYILFFNYSSNLLYHLSKSDRKRAGFIYKEIRSMVAFERKSFRESVSDYAIRIEKLHHLPLKEITELYLKAVFSPKYTKEDHQDLMMKKDLFIQMYKLKISQWRRVLVFIFPFIRSFHK